MINSRYKIQEFADELELEMIDVANLYCDFLLEIGQAIKKMKSFISIQDYTMLEGVVHGIKGLAANCRIDDVFLDSEAFDIQLKKNEFDNCQYYMDIISNKFSDAESEIKRAFLEIDITLDY